MPLWYTLDQIRNTSALILFRGKVSNDCAGLVVCVEYSSLRCLQCITVKSCKFTRHNMGNVERKRRSSLQSSTAVPLVLNAADLSTKNCFFVYKRRSSFHHQRWAPTWPWGQFDTEVKWSVCKSEAPGVIAGAQVQEFRAELPGSDLKIWILLASRVLNDITLISQVQVLSFTCGTLRSHLVQQWKIRWICSVRDVWQEVRTSTSA